MFLDWYLDFHHVTAGKIGLAQKWAVSAVKYSFVSVNARLQNAEQQSVQSVPKCVIQGILGLLYRIFVS